ncbi:MAG TPA: hypothetical protein VLY24_03010 [Bryobacteraceae bacterium]|nr:hypothetical protein [Bryobacteraceae bacterium]
MIVRWASIAALSLLCAAAMSWGQAPELNQQPGLNGGLPRKRGPRPPSKPTPHWPDGHVNLGPAPGEHGLWSGMAGTTLATNSRGIDTFGLGLNLPTNLKVADVPFLPWARALYDLRQSRLTADDPHVRCKPSGGARLFHTPYGFELIDEPDLKRIYMIEVGGPHTWREIYMDGREHPKNPEPSFLGHSIGRWEGETLVVDTVGFNERFWVSREGIPHTTALHTTERFTRVDYDDLRYEITIDDPGAYSKPWSGGFMIRWSADEELYEYMCQENNRDVRHMYGGER